jgi:hypothetical protein
MLVIASVKVYDSCCGRIGTGEYLHKRALTGTVLADETVALAGIYVECQVRKCPDRLNWSD